MNEVLRLSGDNDCSVEIERSLSDAFDVLLIVRVRCRGCAATIDTWIGRDAWLAFAQALSVLEETRRGEALLDSPSPGELNIVVRSLDPAGHMGIEGSVGTRTYDGEALLRFSVFSFDPSQLVDFARGARSIAAAVTAER